MEEGLVYIYVGKKWGEWDKSEIGGSVIDVT